MVLNFGQCIEIKRQVTNLTLSHLSVAQDSILVLNAESPKGQLRKLGYKLGRDSNVTESSYDNISKGSLARVFSALLVDSIQRKA